MTWKQFDPLESWLQVCWAGTLKALLGPGPWASTQSPGNHEVLHSGGRGLAPPRPGWGQGTAASNPSCGSFLGSGGFLTGMHCPGVYCESREALCGNPMLALCDPLLSSTQPCRVCLPWFSRMLILILLIRGVTRLSIYLCILPLPPHSLQTLLAVARSYCTVISFVPSLSNPCPSLSDV